MADMPVGINPIILNDKGEILLGRRKNCFGEGTYCLPGGHLQEGESFENCAVREVFEETGLIVKEEDVEVINIANTPEGKHHIQIGVLVKKYEGSPEIKEPEKCDDLRFFSLDKLPKLFKNNEINIKLFIEGKFYSNASK